MIHRIFDLRSVRTVKRALALDNQIGWVKFVICLIKAKNKYKVSASLKTLTNSKIFPKAASNFCFVFPSL